MKWVVHAKEGLLNLYFSKLRSSLALLGILVGTASVVAMVLGGELATHEALKQFQSLGTDLLSIGINANSDENANVAATAETLTLSQALQLPKASKHILAVAPYTALFYPVFYNGNQLNSVILGVTDRFADIVHIQLKAGRFVSFVDKYAFYCVIGSDLYQAMKAISFKEPLGQQLQIGKNIFTIIGVAKPWPENSFIYANIDNAVLVPILASAVVSKFSVINNVIMRLSSDADIPQAEQRITQYINHYLPTQQVIFRSAKELIAKMKDQSDILTVFLGLIGGISLLVGGIGVMNIMLVSVMERRREIGIRLAVGARRADIRALFLMEAVMLSVVGGILGVIMGTLIAFLIAWFWHWEFTLFLLPPFAGFSISVAVGIFFGFYPAYLASKLNPIDALRIE